MVDINTFVIEQDGQQEFFAVAIDMENGANVRRFAVMIPTQSNEQQIAQYLRQLADSVEYGISGEYH